MTSRPINWIWWGIAVALTAVKLWLTRGQAIFVIGNAGHDDLLFIQLAHHLAQGDWLGPYTELTLSKGPFYPIFIAVCFGLGIPLFLGQHLFYAFACALFVRALQPAIASSGFRVIIYLVLLWNPMTFDMSGMGRVLRQQVYGPLALVMIAGLVALYFRRSEHHRRLLPWTILTGLAAGAFYLTREETLWIIPSLFLLAIAYIVGAFKTSRASTHTACGQLGLILVIAALPLLTVSALNHRYYGWFGTCEFRAAEFQDAYGAMSRVRVPPELPFVPVTREAREAIAGVSPKFATLQKEFDSQVGVGWAKASEFFTHLPPSEEQIGGGWFMWAVRDAAARAGHADSASEAISFYGALADEINHACEIGLLPSGPPRSGFLPVWHQAQASDFVRNLRVFTDYVVRFSHFSAQSNPSFGSSEQLQLFRTMTGEQISPSKNARDIWKTDTLHQWGKTIRLILPTLIYLSMLSMCIRALWMLWHRRWNYPLTLAFASLGAPVASIFIHAFIHTTSFPVLTVTSFAPVYPLLLVFITAATWDLCAAWGNRAQGLALGKQSSDPEIPLTPHVLSGPFKHGFPWLMGLFALAPFLIWHREFAKLIWFGDDLFLLDQIAMMGLGKWSSTVFSENFVPLFKILWGQAVFTFNGSYLAMLWLLWLTHAFNTALFARILQRAAFPRIAVLISTLVFATTPANLETLGWSVQWSAVLATCFMLMGINWLLRHPHQNRSFSWSLHGMLFICATASACSFSRGVLTGGVLALGLLLPLIYNFQIKSLLRRLPGLLLPLLPAITVALLIKTNSSGNHQHLAGHWGEVLEYGLSFYLLNPLLGIIGETSLHPFLLLLASGSKIIVVLSALFLSRGHTRHLLLMLLAYDLGNALLVGIGRYHTGFLAALSSRYQYSSLISTLPSGALLLSMGLSHIPALSWRRWAGAVIVAGLLLHLYRGWPGPLETFTIWRGTEVRQHLAAPASTDPTQMSASLDFMHIERAKALQRAYNLH